MLLGLVAITMCFSAAFFPYVPQLLSSTGIARPSAWMTTSQWSEILFIGILPLILLRVKPRWLMLWGLCCGGLRCICFVAYAAGKGWAFAILGLAMHGPVTAFTFVTMQIFMEENLAPELRNRAQALVSLFGSGIGPVIGLTLSGLIASATILPGQRNPSSWIAFWAAFALLHLLAASLAFFHLRRKQVRTVAAEVRRLALDRARGGGN